MSSFFKKDYGEIEVGDRVIYRVYLDHWVWARVLEIDHNDINGPYVIYLLDKKVVYRTSSIYLKKIPWYVGYVNLSMLECECGLKYVKNGSVHSMWCKLYNKNT